MYNITKIKIHTSDKKGGITLKLFYGNAIYITQMHFLEYSVEYQCYIYQVDTPPQFIEDWSAPDITIRLYIGEDFTNLCFYSELLSDDALWQTFFDAQNGIINPLFYIIDSNETDVTEKEVDKNWKMC